MKQVAVGVGELKISSNPGEIIKTFALGSCVAIIVYDMVNNIAGMIHLALPDSSINGDKALILPGYFADTGIPLLLSEMGEKGATRRNSWIKVAGGASSLNEKFSFDIGRRNLLAVKKILWKNNLGIKAKETGGSISRTVSVRVDNGEVMLSSSGKEWFL